METQETKDVKDGMNAEIEQNAGEGQVTETSKTKGRWFCPMKQCWSKCKGKSKWLLAGGLLLAILIVAGGRFAWERFEKKHMNEVKTKTEAFIKDKMVQPGTEFTVTDFKEERGLYKMSISVGKQSVEAYVTKDGKNFFPGAVDMDKKEDASADAKPNAPAPVTEVSNKQDVPTVELFVMSYCPYGLQAEKGVLPVVRALGSKIKFDIKFVSYVMHGKKEFDENLNQYCIQKETPGKYVGYLDCFAKSANGDSAQCMKTAGVSSTAVAACVAKTDAQYKLSDAFNAFDSSKGGFPPFDIQKDLNVKYGVEGSPSLVVNGQLVDASRDSAGLLKTICSGFSKAPEACKTNLSSDTPSPGFGDGKTKASAPANASCGN